MRKFGVGVVGCGNIAPIYFENCAHFENLRLVACADRDAAKAKELADKYSVTACTVDELLANQDVDIVLNLTVPAAHAEISLAALNAGKHVYLEKPFGLSREEGRSILEAADAQGLKVGCAPDTFLGAGLQTCRTLIDNGAIGRPIAATAFMLGHGPEGWHPNPEFFYQHGGGPMMDMGPYYLTALVSLLGPVRTVCGATSRSFATRTIGSGEKKGREVPVEIDTHLAGVLLFESGVLGTLVTSFDVWAAEVPLLEIYGTKGSLSLPDPNTFGGPVRHFDAEGGEWREMEFTRAYSENSRGIGVADLASAIQNNRPARASGELGYHILDAMVSLHECGTAGSRIDLQSRVEQPKALPPDLKAFEID